MKNRIYVGFGFGAIQAGLFLYEAYRSGAFKRLIVAEIMPDVVNAVRKNGGKYAVNIATARGLEQQTVEGVEILNPQSEADRKVLINALSEADEIGTALPSVKFYGTGDSASVIDLLIESFSRRAAISKRPAIIYTAENHNHAAEILEEGLALKGGNRAADFLQQCQALNTVIGKMSGVVTDPAQIRLQKLLPITPDSNRCFLVEEFNRILITRIRHKDFKRGLSVFEEKDDLLPFEEAKLYGHNATHALLGYLANRRGYAVMSDIANDSTLLALARDAFLLESGAALCCRYKGIDPLFTTQGYAAYADDLLKRMVNPHLNDAVERVIRDPQRKLGWDDRLIGTMRMALAHGIVPGRYAVGAAAACACYLKEKMITPPEQLWADLWGSDKAGSPEGKTLSELIDSAAGRLKGLG